MKRIALQIDRITQALGKLCGWAILLMVVITATVALLRYFFGIGWIWLQESVTYLHSLFFLGTVSYGLLKEGHVRVDIFYRTATQKTQAKVDLLGSLFLLMPFCLLILTQSFGYVVSSWSIVEGSRETGGIPATFLLKSLILLFATNLFLQAVSQSIKASLTLSQRPL